MGTTKCFRSDIQGLKKGKEHVQDGELSQQPKSFFDHHEESSGHEKLLVRQHGENGCGSLIQPHSVPHEADNFIKLDVPDFCGNRDPDLYLDLVHSLEAYFRWYNTSENRRLQFAKAKLKGTAIMQ